MTNQVRKHVNNFKTTLDESVADSDTAFDIVDATRLGTIAAGDYIPCTIDNRAGDFEIIHVYDVTGNTITDCARGMEGTAAQNWALGDLIECRLTATAIDERTTALNSLYATLPTELITFNGALRWYPPKSIVLKNVFACIDTAPAVQDIILNVRINGTQIFTSPKPTIEVGNTTSTPLAIDELVESTDYITIDCEQADGNNVTLRIDYIPEEV